jgi:hypothetical protein
MIGRMDDDTTVIVEDVMEGEDEEDEDDIEDNKAGEAARAFTPSATVRCPH